MKNQIDLNFTAVALIVLVVMKLASEIQWSWVWVLAPLWAPGIGEIICKGLHWLLNKMRWD